MRRVPAVCLVVAFLACAQLISPHDADSSVQRAFPRAGKVVSAPPLLRWPRVSSAHFYNVQVVRNGRKVLSRWPSRPRLQLHRKWTYAGRIRRLRPAVYTWYVYPWLGSRWGGARVRSYFVRGTIPVNTTRPALSGEPREQEALTTSAGRWSGTRPMRFAYRWRRCDAAGHGCVEIAGAMGNEYAPVAADVGRTLRAVVTATNLARSRSAASTPTPVILPAPPRNTSSPSIWGPLWQGATVTAASGAWMSAAPISYEFQWKRCAAAGSPCWAIRDATAQAHQLARGDVERRLQVVITASNAGGAQEVRSAPSPVIGRSLAGTSADDVIRGSRGADLIRGGGGADIVRGRGGNDRLRGGSGADRLYGGRGRDTIFARGGSRDLVSCGPGKDRAVVDRFDRVSGCETVIRR